MSHLDQNGWMVEWHRGREEESAHSALHGRGRHAGCSH
jgi:hypothetical protein